MLGVFSLSQTFLKQENILHLLGTIFRRGLIHISIASKFFQQIWEENMSCCSLICFFFKIVLNKSGASWSEGEERWCLSVGGTHCWFSLFSWDLLRLRKTKNPTRFILRLWDGFVEISWDPVPTKGAVLGKKPETCSLLEPRFVSPLLKKPT